MTHWRRPDEPDPIGGLVAFAIVAALVVFLLLLAHSCARAQGRPFIAIIASVCLNDNCKEVMVTTSAQVPTLTMTSCQIGQRELAEWLMREWPGYQLGGWKCIRGERRHET